MEEEEHRKIIHVDMDAFYASVEQHDNPSLKGKPIAVGGGSDRGVVSAASYEARKFGVRSAMSSALAKRKCPDLIFVKPRFERYKEISQQIRAIFHDYTDLVEPLSLDEAYLDVTANQTGHSSATEIAEEIRQRIFEETGLTASAGISINKFVAKIASDINKPNGQKTIKPREVIPFLERLPIYKFYGIGKATAQKMNSWGIYNGLQLKQHSREFLTQTFGKAGKHYYNIVRGIHNSPVRPDRERKSVGCERTYADNISGQSQVTEKLEWLTNELQKRLDNVKIKGRTLTLKIKFSDFSSQTRSVTFDEPINDTDQIYSAALSLYEQEETKKSIRLLGLSVSNLKMEEEEKKRTGPKQLEFTF